MSVAILLVTHEDLGARLAEIAAAICCQDTSPVACIAIPASVEPQQLGAYADRIRDAISGSNDGSGVLVLTDVYGATPDNLARHFSAQCQARVISGLNLPMLLRVLHYPRQTLEQLCDTAVDGARSGIRLNGGQHEEPGRIADTGHIGDV